MRLLKLSGQAINLDQVARYIDVPGDPRRIELQMSFGGSIILEGQEAVQMRRFIDQNSHPGDADESQPEGSGPETESVPESAAADTTGDLYHSARGSEVLPTSRRVQPDG